MSIEKGPTPEQSNEDLKSEEGVVAFMRSSRSDKEWRANCDKVKAANHGYPGFWFQAVITSGVAIEAKKNWSEKE